MKDNPPLTLLPHPAGEGAKEPGAPRAHNHPVRGYREHARGFFRMAREGERCSRVLPQLKLEVSVRPTSTKYNYRFRLPQKKIIVYLC